MAQRSGYVEWVRTIPRTGMQVGNVREYGTAAKYQFSFIGDPTVSSGQGVLFDLATSQSGVDYATNLTLPPPKPPQAIWGPREAQMQDGVTSEMAGYWLTGKKGG